MRLGDSMEQYDSGEVLSCLSQGLDAPESGNNE